MFVVAARGREVPLGGSFRPARVCVQHSNKREVGGGVSRHYGEGGGGWENPSVFIGAHDKGMGGRVEVFAVLHGADKVLPGRFVPPSR